MLVLSLISIDRKNEVNRQGRIQTLSIRGA